MRAIFAILTPRDHDFVLRWFKTRGISFAESTLDVKLIEECSAALLSEQANATMLVHDPVGDALKTVISGLNEGELGLLSPMILDHATGDDRAVIETWFSSRSSVQ